MAKYALRTVIEFLLLLNEKKLKDFKNYAKDNDDFCYAVLKKEKNQDLEGVVNRTDKILIKTKAKFKKKNNITR